MKKPLDLIDQVRPTCGNCTFWSPSNDGSFSGECRRTNPTAEEARGYAARFPRIDDFKWCGAHNPHIFEPGDDVQCDNGKSGVVEGVFATSMHIAVTHTFDQKSRALPVCYVVRLDEPWPHSINVHATRLVKAEK